MAAMTDVTAGLTDAEIKTFVRCGELLGMKVYFPEKIHKVEHAPLKYHGRFPTPTAIVDGKGVDFLPYMSNDLTFRLINRLRIHINHDRYPEEIVIKDRHGQVRCSVTYDDLDVDRATRIGVWKLLTLLMSTAGEIE